jgi:hypothetical protein
MIFIITNVNNYLRVQSEDLVDAFVELVGRFSLACLLSAFALQRSCFLVVIWLYLGLRRNHYSKEIKVLVAMI